MATSSGVGLAEDERAAGLDDAGLLGGHVDQRRAGVLEVVGAGIGHDRDLAVDDVGGVPPSQQPHLDGHHVDGDVREPAKGGRGDDLEVASSTPASTSRSATAEICSAELLVADGLAVAVVRSFTRSRWGLVKVPTVRPWATRRRVRSARSSPCRCAGDVDGGRGPLRLSHELHEPLDRGGGSAR